MAKPMRIAASTAEDGSLGGINAGMVRLAHLLLRHRQVGYRSRCVMVGCGGIAVFIGVGLRMGFISVLIERGGVG